MSNFWQWYNKNYKNIVRLSTILFLLQVVHLVWLTSDIVIPKLFNIPGAFPYSLRFILALVDYTEIPALISVSFIYWHNLITGKDKNKSWFYLLLLNSQWLHMAWITDEVVANTLIGHAPVSLPFILVWIAIFIDYLELPVMLDTLRRAFGKANLFG